MSVSAVRIVEFDAGHRVAGHEGKCAHVHGHRYKVELHARTIASVVGGRELDDVGRVVDFSVLKNAVGGWIDRSWDHRTLFWEDDPFALALDVNGGEDMQEILIETMSFVPFNPTAENIASYLVETVCPAVLEGAGVEVFYVVVWETPNCYAAATKRRKDG